MKKLSLLLALLALAVAPLIAAEAPVADALAEAGPNVQSEESPSVNSEIIDPALERVFVQYGSCSEQNGLPCTQNTACWENGEVFFCYCENGVTCCGPH